MLTDLARETLEMNHEPKRAVVHPLAAAALLMSLLVLTVGCDTIAEISFDIRKYDRVRSPGVTNTNVCQEDDSRAELRFVLLDQQNNVIRPGDQLSSTTVSVGGQFSSNNVSVESGRIYATQPPNLVLCARPCDGGGDCEAGQTCSDEGFCLPEFQEDDVDPADACRPLGMSICKAYDDEIDSLEGFQGIEDLSFCRVSCGGDDDCPSGSCVNDGGVSYCALNSPGDFCESNAQCGSGFQCLPIEGDTGGPGGTARKLCTRETGTPVVQGSLEFLSPPADGAQEAPRAVALVVDNSGSLYGRGVTEADRTVKLARATDPNLFRIASAKTFLLTLGNQSFKENAVVSLWSYRGESELGVKPLTGNIGVTPPNPYVSNFDVVRDALDTMSADSDFGRSNVFDAISSVAQNMVDLCANNPRCTTLSDLRDTSIVLFTDGPDDSVTVTPGGDASELELGRQRWDGKFQEALSTVQEAGARVYIIHLDEAIGADGLAALEPDPSNARPFARDAEGRTGPLDEFSQIACASGGQYIYVTDPFALNFYFSLMSDLIGGTWKVDIGVEAFDTVVDNGPYRFGANVGINLDGRTESFFLSPFGNQTSLGQIDTDDTRPVIFKRTARDVDPFGGDGAGGGGGGDQ